MWRRWRGACQECGISGLIGTGDEDGKGKNQLGEKFGVDRGGSGK